MGLEGMLGRCYRVHIVALYLYDAKGLVLSARVPVLGLDVGLSTLGSWYCAVRHSTYILYISRSGLIRLGAKT